MALTKGDSKGANGKGAGGGRRHTGRGQGKGQPHPKGRQLDDQALADVQALLGERPHDRDLLIEFLHLIQDRYGHLSAAHMRALAEEMRLSQTEVFEVATFYAHFDPLKEGEAAPPGVTIRVCDSLTCEVMGAKALMEALDKAVDPAEVRVVRAPCMGRCDTAPVAEVGHRHIDDATAENIQAAIAAGDTHPVIPAYQSYEDYVQEDGYKQLAACRSGALTVDAVMETLDQAGLRGLGGAGFPSHRKRQFVRGGDAPRYLAINGDEGEPGTFKDRHYLETEPHRFLEGTLITAWGIEAEKAYIYMRDEYPAVLKILKDEIRKLEDEGLAAPGYLTLRRGAGAYICGEESAMLESIEGKRGLPRHRPPYAAQVGLFGRPPLIHDVETVTWMPTILAKGPAWFADQGQGDSKDVAVNLLKFFENESCGQCTPCRIGCEKAVKLMSEKAWDQPLLNELGKAMSDASIRGLGQAAPNPIRSVMTFFPDEIA